MRIIYLILNLLLLSYSCMATEKPEFLDLKEIDPTIKIFSDGASNLNFIGRPFNGYNNPNKIIVSKKLGLALRTIQSKLKEKNLSLLVYDAYRPQMAVDDFINWSKDISNQKNEEIFLSLY